MDISAVERGEFRRLMKILLAPLSYPDSVAWRAAAMESARRLTGAENVTFSILPLETPATTLNVDPELHRVYFRRFASIDPGPTNRRRKRLKVAVQRDIYPRNWQSTELFADFLEPYSLLGGVMMAHDFANGEEAWLTAALGSLEELQDFEERFVPAWKILQPAFEAGVEIQVQAEAAGQALAAFLDDVPVPAVLFTLDGAERYRNRLLRSLMSGLSDAAQLQRRLRRTCTTMSRFAQPHRKTARGTIPSGSEWAVIDDLEMRIRSTFLPPGILGPAPGVLVTVEAPPSSIMSNADMASRFGLSTREVEVTRLLVRGRSTKAIATRLGISRHTARRHVESVMSKLGVSSRAAVGGRIGGVIPRE